MTLQKNKYTEEYKRQKTFPKGIEKFNKETIRDYKSASVIQEKWEKACTVDLKELNFIERLELINLREENHRLLKEIEILMQAILIVGSKVDK